jgi:diacylglycerol kinase (ATP)
MNRIQSFKCAFNGIKSLFATELNARIHLALAIAVITAGIVFCISATEWAIVAICIGLVLAMEAVNTALEQLCNFVEPEKHSVIGKIKDMAAGAVLLVSITAATAGLMIFIPKIIAL